MATLAETPSHGRLPKSLNTKLVKLFPSGLLVYTTEKPPRFRGWNALVSLIIVTYFLTVSPTPPPHSFVLLLSSVACSIPLGHWRHASETAWVGSMNSYSIISTLVLSCCEVPLLITMAPVSSLHPVSPWRAMCISLSHVMLVVFLSMRNNLLLSWCYWCQELCSVYVPVPAGNILWIGCVTWLITSTKWRFCKHSPMVSLVVLVIDPVFFIPF